MLGVLSTQCKEQQRVHELPHKLMLLPNPLGLQHNTDLVCGGGVLPVRCSSWNQNPPLLLPKHSEASLLPQEPQADICELNRQTLPPLGEPGKVLARGQQG